MAGKDEDLDDLLDGTFYIACFGVKMENVVLKLGGGNFFVTDALNDFDKLEVKHTAVNTDPSKAPTSSSFEIPFGDVKPSQGAAENAKNASGSSSSAIGSAPNVSEEEAALKFAQHMRELFKDVEDDPALSALLDGITAGEKASSSSSSSSTQGGASSSTPETDLDQKIAETLEQLSQNVDKAVRGRFDRLHCFYRGVKNFLSFSRCFSSLLWYSRIDIGGGIAAKFFLCSHRVLENLAVFF